MYFARKPSQESANPPSETYERMLDHFLKGPNDKFRDKRFKLIPSVEAPANTHAAGAATRTAPAIVDHDDTGAVPTPLAAVRARFMSVFGGKVLEDERA